MKQAVVWLRQVHGESTIGEVIGKAAPVGESLMAVGKDEQTWKAASVPGRGAWREEHGAREDDGWKALFNVLQHEGFYLGPSSPMYVNCAVKAMPRRGASESCKREQISSPHSS